MMSVSTLAQRRALAPAARRQRALTSVGRNPREAGERYRTASRSVRVIIVGETLVQRVPL